MTLRSSLARFGRVSLGDRDTSVIRRSLWVTFFFTLGHVCYYCLIVLANRNLSPADFGRFYTGWAILNVLGAPGGVFVLLLSGYFAAAFRRGYMPALIAALGQAARQAVWPTILALLACEAALAIGGRIFAIDAFWLGFLLPLTAVASFMVEVLRATYQGRLQFVRYGVYWTVWCALQLLFGAVGLFLFDTPWAVFAGMLAANTAVFAFLLARILLQVPPEKRLHRQQRLSLREFMPLTTGLAASVVLINMDILMSYFMFSAVVNGVYAASALLAKAIVTATQPIIQIMIPVMTHAEGAPVDKRVVTIKTIGAAATFASLGAIVLWLGAPQVCGGRYGIQYCDVPIMGLLAVSAIPLVILRVLVVANVSYKQRGIAELMYAAVAVFVFCALRISRDAHALAAVYCLCCWGALGLGCVLQCVRAIERRRDIA